MDPRIALIALPALSAPGVEVALVDIEQVPSLGEDAERLLCADECKRFAAIGNVHRRREWLAARIGIKQLAIDHGLAKAFADCRIAQDRRGRPALVDRLGRSIPGVCDCSLSHKGRYACVALGRGPAEKVGVDIEVISDRLQRLRDAFLHPLDAKEFRTDRDADLAALWTLKEAYSKLIGIGLPIGLRNIFCDRALPDIYARVQAVAGPPALARHVVYSHYAIAVCFTTNDRRKAALRNQVD